MGVSLKFLWSELSEHALLVFGVKRLGYALTYQTFIILHSLRLAECALTCGI